MPLECRVLGLFGERWGEAAREPCGAPDGADRNLLLSFVLKKSEREQGQNCCSYSRHVGGKKRDAAQQGSTASAGLTLLLLP